VVGGMSRMSLARFELSGSYCWRRHSKISARLPQTNCRMLSAVTRNGAASSANAACKVGATSGFVGEPVGRPPQISGAAVGARALAHPAPGQTSIASRCRARKAVLTRKRRQVELLEAETCHSLECLFEPRCSAPCPIFASPDAGKPCPVGQTPPLALKLWGPAPSSLERRKIGAFPEPP